MRLVGIISDKEYQKAKFALEVCNLDYDQAKTNVLNTQILTQRNPTHFSPPIVEGLMEFQWNIFVEEMKRV